jgi:hypothetical protein
LVGLSPAAHLCEHMMRPGQRDSEAACRGGSATSDVVAGQARGGRVALAEASYDCVPSALALSPVTNSRAAAMAARRARIMTILQAVMLMFVVPSLAVMGVWA